MNCEFHGTSPATLHRIYRFITGKFLRYQTLFDIRYNYCILLYAALVYRIRCYYCIDKNAFPYRHKGYIFFDLASR